MDKLLNTNLDEIRRKINPDGTMTDPTIENLLVRMNNRKEQIEKGTPVNGDDTIDKLMEDTTAAAASPYKYMELEEQREAARKAQGVEGGRRRKSSSSRGRRSSKKRGTQRKQKRRQRRGSRRAY